MTERCAYCHKRPRRKLARQNAERYSPYCTYQCQQYMSMRLAKEHLAALSNTAHLPEARQ